MNPNGKVPVIADDSVVVWEPHAVLRYLAAAHGADDFWPSDPAARAPVDGWMDWAQTALQPAFLGGVFWGGYRTPKDQRDEAAVARAVEQAAHGLTLVDNQLADRPFVVGQALSLADTAIGPHLYRYFELEIERPALPRLQAWYDR
jgi:glutathione S-transferase